MRLFVAVEIPADVRAGLAHALEDVRETAPATLRWSDPSRWHLTLAFLGEVADARTAELTRRLERAAARHTAPVLRLGGAGRFGSRVLWAGVVEDSPGRGTLVPLAGSVSAAARRSGIAQEERGYRPHITLARTQTAVDLRPLVDVLAGTRSRPWTVTEVLLVRSLPGPHPEHTTIRQFPMRA